MKVKVAELFAGVGGFRLGLERARKKSFEVVFSNQWEPNRKTQYASDVYIKRFGEKGHFNKSIKAIKTSNIPNHDLLVGGFPCQDFSVAKARNASKGIKGEKGVLWWEIERIIKDKKPKYFLFENVDRLLKSPSNNLGHDFHAILESLSKQSYIVEWRVINAADYGYPQKRKRVLIFGYKKDSPISNKLSSGDFIQDKMFLNKVFPIKKSIFEKFVWNSELPISYPPNGVMFGRTRIYAAKVEANFRGKKKVLKDVLLPVENIPADFIVAEQDLPRWKYLKGAKDLIKQSRSGYSYRYNEGQVTFPDDLNKPSRTIVTGEGGGSPSRLKHIVQQGNVWRRLTPLELERLNGFPDNFTDGILDTKRAFLMGNALVVGLIEEFAKKFITMIKNTE